MHCLAIYFLTGFNPVGKFLNNYTQHVSKLFLHCPSKVTHSFTIRVIFHYRISLWYISPLLCFPPCKKQALQRMYSGGSIKHGIYLCALPPLVNITLMGERISNASHVILNKYLLCIQIHAEKYIFSKIKFTKFILSSLILLDVPFLWPCNSILVPHSVLPSWLLILASFVSLSHSHFSLTFHSAQSVLCLSNFVSCLLNLC